MAKRRAVTDLCREVRGSSEEHPQTRPPLGSAPALPIGGRARTLLRRGPPHRPLTKMPKGHDQRPQRNPSTRIRLDDDPPGQTGDFIPAAAPTSCLPPARSVTIPPHIDSPVSVCQSN